MKKCHVILSCEHASYQIPTDFSHLFPDKNQFPSMHEAYDLGAYLCYQYLCNKLAITSQFHGKVSRLIVDLNRSPHHHQLFSPAIKALTEAERKNILQVYYYPYHRAIRDHIALQSGGQQIIHVAIHSFTPCLNNVVRLNDIGLLYDPKRLAEQALAKQWQMQLRKQFNTQFNYPYRGDSDGLPTQLRKLYPPHRYLGFEIECNQALLKQPKKWHLLQQSLLALLGKLNK